MILENVPLSDIDTDDTRFRVSLSEPTDALKRSIDDVGLINPPLLYKAEGSLPLIIVCGFLRVACARSLAWKSLPALILETGECSSLECLLRSFNDLHTQRSLTLCEKAVLVSRLRHVADLSPEDIIGRFFSLLRLPADRTTFDRLSTIDRWPDSIKNSASVHELNPAVLLQLADRPVSDAEAVVPFLCDYRWGNSRQREICGYLIELSRLVSRPLPAIIGECLSIRDIGTVETPLPQRAETIRLWLRRRRYPRTTEIEEDFRQVKRSLRIPPQIALNEPPGFEGEHYHVRFKFGSRREYEQILDDLERIGKESHFDDLFRFV